MGELIGDKVKWDNRFGDANYGIFIASMDGVDFDVWEKPTQRYNIDKSLCSYKSRHGAVRYLIVLYVVSGSRTLQRTHFIVDNVLIMARRNPGTIDWAQSESKQIVLDDLKAGMISLDDSDTAEDLYYGMYCHTPEFIAEKVLFPQFKQRLADHRKQVKQCQNAMSWECAALAHDKLLFPPKKYNNRGEEVFYLSTAYSLLLQDIKDGANVGRTPTQLREMREEYKKFSIPIFDQRVRQAIRRQRMINFMNDKREAEVQERRNRRKDLGLAEETPLAFRDSNASA